MKFDWIIKAIVSGIVYSLAQSATEKALAEKEPKRRKAQESNR